MRFDAEQRFDAEVEHLLGLFTDPDFYATLTGLPKISAPELLDHRASGDKVHISYRQRYTGDLPAAAQTMIDPHKISWIEVVVFDLTAATAATHLKPDHYADRFSCRGQYTFSDLGRGRSSRRLDGDLKIRVPLVGGRVEAALISGLKEHADAERDLIEARLVAHAAKQRSEKPPKKGSSKGAKGTKASAKADKAPKPSKSTKGAKSA